MCTVSPCHYLFLVAFYLLFLILHNRIAGQNSRIVYLFKTLPGLDWVSRIAFHAEPFTLRQVVWIHDSNEIPHTFSMCDIQVLKAGEVAKYLWSSWPVFAHGWLDLCREGCPPCCLNMPIIWPILISVVRKRNFSSQQSVWGRTLHKLLELIIQAFLGSSLLPTTFCRNWCLFLHWPVPLCNTKGEKPLL